MLIISNPIANMYSQFILCKYKKIMKSEKTVTIVKTCLIHLNIEKLMIIPHSIVDQFVHYSYEEYARIFSWKRRIANLHLYRNYVL